MIHKLDGWTATDLLEFEVQTGSIENAFYCHYACLYPKGGKRANASLHTVGEVTG